MTISEAPSTIAPVALGALGKLRECVAAARNLEHLIASRDVGPRALEQLILDVTLDLAPWEGAYGDVSRFLNDNLKMEPTILKALGHATDLSSKRIATALQQASGTTMNAKRRLLMERQLRASLPALAAALTQVELLVEATCSTGVPMTVAEFLSSSPDVGTSRPYRNVFLSGPLETLGVRIPARIGLRCLGMISSALSSDASFPLHLSIKSEEDSVVFRFVDPASEATQVAHLPVYLDLPESLDTVDAALFRYGGNLLAGGRGCRVPQTPI